MLASGSIGLRWCSSRCRDSIMSVRCGVYTCLLVHVLTRVMPWCLLQRLRLIQVIIIKQLPQTSCRIYVKGPSAISLLDFGALESELVGRAGEGWRMLTTLSLHAGIFHLVGNLAGLFYVGLQLEREFGFLKVYFPILLYEDFCFIFLLPSVMV